MSLAWPQRGRHLPTFTSFRSAPFGNTKTLSASRVSQLLSQLTILGVFTKHQLVFRGDPITVCLIDNFDGLKNLSEKKNPYSRRTKTVARRQETALRGDPRAAFLEASTSANARFIHDALYTGILDAGMRLSAKDSRNKIVTETTIKGEPLSITTRTRSADSHIAIILDMFSGASLDVIGYARMSEPVNGSIH